MIENWGKWSFEEGCNGFGEVELGFRIPISFLTKKITQRVGRNLDSQISEGFDENFF